MTKLSVNVNKVALLRNSRHINLPDLLHAVRLCLQGGADGITVHPRPDERHIRRADAYDIARELQAHPAVEYNIEGNPFLPPFLDIVRDVKPVQCTLVPDSANTFTSDQGWVLDDEGSARLEPIIRSLRDSGVRVSLFLDAGTDQMARAAALGAHRVELYTEPYAAAFGTPRQEQVFEQFRAAAAAAQAAGLGVNAGHDLNRHNLARLLSIRGILEVSIGHALVADALEFGLVATVREYLRLCRS